MKKIFTGKGPWWYDRGSYPLGYIFSNGFEKKKKWYVCERQRERERERMRMSVCKRGPNWDGGGRREGGRERAIKHMEQRVKNRCIWVKGTQCSMYYSFS